MDEEADKKCFELKSDSSFVTMFKRLQQIPTLIRFFDRGKYFTAHDHNADYIALEYYKSKKGIRIADDLKYVVVRAGIEFQDMVHDMLLKKNLSVEVFAFVNHEWVAVKRGSPGNLQQFEDTIFASAEMHDSSVILSLVTHSTLSATNVGVAFVDSYTQTIGVMEFPDDDQLSNLECAVVQRGAKECLIETVAENNAIGKRLLQVLERTNVAVTQKKKADFNAKDIEQDLSRLLGDIRPHLAALEKRLAMQALACTIKYLELLSSGEQHFKLEVVDLKQFMKLDGAAMSALNLVPSPKDGPGAMNLFNILNHCQTSMGERQLIRWIKQPLIDVNEIIKRQDRVEALVVDTSARRRLQEGIKGIPDLDRLAKRLSSHKGTLQDTVSFYGVIKKIQILQDALSEVQTPYNAPMREEFLIPLEENSEGCSEYIKFVETAINMEKVEKEHVYEINPTQNGDLLAIEKSREAISGKITAEQQSVADSMSIPVSRVKLVEAPQHFFLFRVTKKDSSHVQGKNYRIIDNAKGACRFTTTNLQRLVSKQHELEENYQALSQAVTDKVKEITESFIPLIELVAYTVSRLDVFLSLAEAACVAPTQYIRPEVVPSVSVVDSTPSSSPARNEIVLLDSRHPCVEKGEGIHFIPNNVELRSGESTFQIITGPNMGGKSTYIRQIGVISVMAQLGSFVPCSKAHLSIVDCILCRVGAGDSQLRGVSTFMAEMLETATILRTATPRSLIIIDELGRGTSTYDGFGLAWAISEYICNQIGCLCLFATHFHELTALSERIPFVKNKHVTAHTSENRLVLQYQVKDGPCDQSFGIHVAELADFPPAVIQIAKRKAQELENFGTPRKLPRTASSTPPTTTTSSVRSSVDTTGLSEEEMARGRFLVGQFLKDLCRIPTTLPDEELTDKVTQLRDALCRENNAYVARLIASSKL
ncbi:DNA mismatch repair protein Msh2 [Pelomyxa schiedti]|nr:DNA mismatch repair protein Msh2 [Pelomyxa schiedti]